MRPFKFPLAFLFVLLGVIVSFSATVKRPLTVTSEYGDQYVSCWTGSAGVVTADNLIFMADTAAANVYGMDPIYFRMSSNRESSIGPWRSFPGGVIPNKLCVSLKIAGDADATTSLVYLQQATARGLTHIKTMNSTYTVGAALASQDTLINVASDTLYFRKNLDYDPTKFWKLVVDPVTATDSIEVKGVCVYTCQD